MNVSGLGHVNVRAANIGYLKQYTETHYKLVHMRSVRISGYEERKP